MKHFYLISLLAAVASALAAPVAQAQVGGVVQQDTARNGAITFLRLATAGPGRRAATETGPALRSLLKLRAADELRPQAARADALGFTHTTHAQYYRGVPVEYGMYVTHARHGAIETMNGEVIGIGALDATPALSERAALAQARAAVGAPTSRGQVPAASASPPPGELLVSRDVAAPAGARLAYKFVLETPEPGRADYVYVDAHSGQVFRRVPVAYHANAPVTVTTRYSGAQTITADQLAGGGYRLREAGRGSGTACGGSGASIETYNANGNPPLPSGPVTSLDVTSTATTSWNGNAGAALDAHWAAEKTYDYFNTTFCRNSFDGAGATLKIYTNNGVRDDAYWDSNNKLVVLFNGAGRLAPVTSLDATAHEIAHGYTQSMVGLDITQPETAAISEGISDIWAACVEHAAAPAKQTWLIGEDIILNGYACLRNLASPNAGINPSFSSTGGVPRCVSAGASLRLPYQWIRPAHQLHHHQPQFLPAGCRGQQHQQHRHTLQHHRHRHRESRADSVSC